MTTALRIFLTLVAAPVAWGFVFITNSSTNLPIKWPAGAIAMQVKVDATTVFPGDGSTRSSTLQAAMSAWNSSLGSAQFQPQLLPAGAAGNTNGVNEIVFDTTIFGTAFDSRTLAVTLSRHLGNDTSEADIIFNSNRTWDSYRDSLGSHGGAVDVRRVAIHELGHVLGLDHPDQATPTQSVSAIMNSIVSDIAAATADDIAGVQRLYGPPGVPGNDSFGSALTLTLVGSSTQATGYNTNATKQPGEPLHAGNAGGRSVWWRWIAPAAGNAAVTTQGSIFDTTLGVYTGSAVGALTTLASSDDLNPGITQYSTLTFSAAGGTTYYFAVDGFDGDSGFVTLNLSFTPTPGHSADTSPADGVINLAELTRVIELFNVRNGTVRTGRYAVAVTATSDGFAPDPATANGATVTLTKYHSADSDRDGKLTLTELTRVIEFYSARVGGVRTGQYHAQLNSEDGFAPGP